MLALLLCAGVLFACRPDTPTPPDDTQNPPSDDPGTQPDPDPTDQKCQEYDHKAQQHIHKITDHHGHRQNQSWEVDLLYQILLMYNR